MFVVLELEEDSRRGMIRFLRGILSKPKPLLEEMSYQEVRYWRIRAPVVRKQVAQVAQMAQMAQVDQVDWEEIRELAGRLAGRVLLPEGIAPEPEWGISSPACPGFERKVLLDTACRLIAETRMPMYRRVLGLVDLEGKYTDFLPELLKYYTAVRVVTDRVETYEAVAERMMEDFGAPVMVSGAFSAFEDCVLALIPEPEKLPVTEIRCPVFAGGAFVRREGDILTDPVFAPRLDPAALLPPGISPHRFAGALHEYGGVDFRRYAAEEVLYNYRRCTLKEAAGEIARKAEEAPKLAYF